jgi:hypothetical protein
MAPRYKVTLTKEEREDLEGISTKVKRAARTVLYARALLLLDAGEHGPKEKWVVTQVAEALGTTARSLEHLKKRFVEEGLSAALERKERETPPREIQFGGEFEAHLLALACSDAPAGRKRWTVRLLAEKMVELKMVPSVSPMTVCNTLKKMNLSLTKANTGRYRRIKTPVL